MTYLELLELDESLLARLVEVFFVVVACCCCCCCWLSPPGVELVDDDDVVVVAAAPLVDDGVVVDDDALDVGGGGGVFEGVACWVYASCCSTCKNVMQSAVCLCYVAADVSYLLLELLDLVLQLLLLLKHLLDSLLQLMLLVLRGCLLCEDVLLQDLELGHIML